VPDLIFCLRRLLALGYDHPTALRLARWACDPAAPLYPEHHQEKAQ
jgi:hypothetical protein